MYTKGKNYIGMYPGTFNLTTQQLNAYIRTDRHIYTYVYKDLHIYVFINIYMYVCMYMGIHTHVKMNIVRCTVSGEAEQYNTLESVFQIHNTTVLT